MTETDATRIPVAAAAPLLGVSARTLQRRLEAGIYDAIRDETDRRAPFLVLLSSLPEEAQKKYQPEQGGALIECRSESTQLAPLAQALPEASAEPAPRYSALWVWYEKLDTPSKDKANAAFEAVKDFYDARDAGVSIGMASAAVTQKHGISATTLWRYRNDVDGHPRGHWLPLLAPRYCGNGQEAEFTEEAWAWILDKHLEQTEIETSVLVRLACHEGEGRGWVIPSTRTVDRRLKRESAGITILGRRGARALEASFPTAEKDWASIPLHEMWVSDGCRLNYVARWPDGSQGRPFVVVWQECRSRLPLSCKGYLNPCGELVMTAFLEAIKNCGYKPNLMKLDNGREYANKAFTGGQKTRYRFKLKPGEPIGVATQMGINVEWAKPARGRDKIIESFNRFMHANLKSMGYAEAYCGKDALSKPEDFDPRKAVPIELVNKAMGEFLHWFSTQHKHRGHGMNGRTPQAVYEELLPTINKAEHTPDPAHLRLLLMAVKTLKPDKDEATFKFKLDGYGERRYWSEEFSRLPLAARQKKYHVWYHPENPDLPVSIYDGDKLVCDCYPINRIPAVGAGEAAGAHVKAKNALMKPYKEELKAIRAAPLAKLPNFATSEKLIDDRPKDKPQPAAVSILQPTGNPGEQVNTETGRTIRRIERSTREPKPSVDLDRLEMLRRQQAAKRAVA
jgi:hypothetical protein